MCVCVYIYIYIYIYINKSKNSRLAGATKMDHVGASSIGGHMLYFLNSRKSDSTAVRKWNQSVRAACHWGVGPQMDWSWAERPGQEVLATSLSQEAED